jgi:hypothetical protein
MKFTPSEQMVMEQTLKASFLRAADIIDRITEQDVIDAQLVLHREGISKFEDLWRVDRAMLAAAHFRAIALKGSEARVKPDDLKAAIVEGAK